VTAPHREQRPEVSLVKRQETPGSEAVGQYYYRQIGEPDVQVLVATIEVQHERVLVGGQTDHLEASLGDVLEEFLGGASTAALTKQVVDLG
jgi:hypothetical protein